MLRMKTKTVSPHSLLENTHKDDYIEIRLPKISFSQLKSINSLKQINDQKVTPVIVVLLFVAAYLLGVVTAHIQPFVK